MTSERETQLADCPHCKTYGRLCGVHGQAPLATAERAVEPPGPVKAVYLGCPVCAMLGRPGCYCGQRWLQRSNSAERKAR